jgi:hypothetical protein
MSRRNPLEAYMQLPVITQTEPSLTLRLLSQRHAAAVVDLPTAAQECALAHQTLLNQLSRGTCRLPVFKQGRRWCVRLTDLSAFIDEQYYASNPTSVSGDEPRRRGRPTKAQQVARRITHAAKVH